MTVLVADDDPIVRRVLHSLLVSWGYDVIAVQDGEAAWRVLASPNPPGIALVDGEMPGVDGPDLCRRARSLSGEAYTYLVLLTGHRGRDNLVDGLEAGADEYLTKPFDELELRARLRAAARIVRLQRDLLRATEALRQQAMHDGLTGALNRRGVMEVYQGCVAEMRRRGGGIGLVTLDLDRFKAINDGYGHDVGDAVLRETVRRIAGVLRPYDRIGRMGGEEFLVVLPGCDEAAAAAVAERLRQALAAEPIVAGDAIVPVTASFGAGWTADPDVAELLLVDVDRAVYQAKHSGRNRVVSAQPRAGARVTTSS